MELEEIFGFTGSIRAEKSTTIKMLIILIQSN